jgi:AraC-like DNA-binding protein
LSDGHGRAFLVFGWSSLSRVPGGAQPASTANVSHILKVMDDARSDVQTLGLMAFRAVGGHMRRPHLHPEVEFNLLLSGSARYETATGHLELPPGRMLAFWGGYPHRMLAASGIDMLGATMPLSAVTGQPVLRRAMRRLLNGEALLGTRREGTSDRALLRRWLGDLGDAPPRDGVDLCLLEMTARLARLAGNGGPAGRSAAPSRSADRLLAVVAAEYTEPLSIEDIALKAGVHPTYAAMTFKEVLGMPIWGYVTRLRVAHACRLLESTDRTVDQIGHASGFRSRSSFHRAFRATVGRTPADYRASRASSSSFIRA